MKRFVVFTVLLLVVLVMVSVVSAGGRPLSATLLGENEVNPGDPDGFGTADLTLNQGQGEICFELSWRDIDAPTRAHIHNAPAGMNGGIVVFFFDTVIADPIPVTNSGCVDAEPDLIKAIRQNPEDYYVNIHNAAFPGGAIRGQLSK